MLYNHKLVCTIYKSLCHVTLESSHVTLTHDELVLSGVVQNFDKFHDVRVIEFLQNGDLAVNIVQGACYPH